MIDYDPTSIILACGDKVWIEAEIAFGDAVDLLVAQSVAVKIKGHYRTADVDRSAIKSVSFKLNKGDDVWCRDVDDCGTVEWCEGGDVLVRYGTILKLEMASSLMPVRRLPEPVVTKSGNDNG